MKPSSNDVGLPIPFKIASAGLAGCTADLATFPLDTIKVWLMVRGESAGGTNNASKSASTKFPKTPGQHAKDVFQESRISDKLRTIPLPQNQNRTVYSGSSASLKQFLQPSNFKSTGSASFTELSSSELYMLKKASMTANPSQVNMTKTVINDALSSAIKLHANATQTFNELTLSELYMAQKKAMARINPVESTKGAIQTIISNVKKSGVRSLYSGLNAGLQRQIGFCSIRIGFYDNVKNFYVSLLPGAPDSKMIGQRILAGATTGCLAVLFFQPTEVVKIRMQAEKGRYKGSFQAYKSVYRTGGIAELWKGIGANCARTGVVNVCELVTYDIVKETILKRRLMTDNLPCHFTSALISGFITTVVASPVDVVKTRYMNSEKGAYKNPIQCAGQMLKSEGLRAFYKGFVPSYLRLGSWNIVMFVSYEQYKRFFKDVASSTPEFPVPHMGAATTPLLTPTPAEPEPVYPSYVEAMYHSQQDSGPLS